jgi:hypothetical protein
LRRQPEFAGSEPLYRALVSTGFSDTGRFAEMVRDGKSVWKNAAYENTFRSGLMEAVDVIFEKNPAGITAANFVKELQKYNSTTAKVLEEARVTGFSDYLTEHSNRPKVANAAGQLKPQKLDLAEIKEFLKANAVEVRVERDGPFDGQVLAYSSYVFKPTGPNHKYGTLAMRAKNKKYFPAAGRGNHVGPDTYVWNRFTRRKISEGSTLLHIEETQAQNNLELKQAAAEAMKLHDEQVKSFPSAGELVSRFSFGAEPVSVELTPREKIMALLSTLPVTESTRIPSPYEAIDSAINGGENYPGKRDFTALGKVFDDAIMFGQDFYEAFADINLEFNGNVIRKTGAYLHDYARAIALGGEIEGQRVSSSPIRADFVRNAIEEVLSNRAPEDLARALRGRGITVHGSTKKEIRSSLLDIVYMSAVNAASSTSSRDLNSRATEFVFRQVDALISREDMAALGAEMAAIYNTMMNDKGLTPLKAHSYATYTEEAVSLDKYRNLFLQSLARRIRKDAPALGADLGNGFINLVDPKDTEGVDNAIARLLNRAVGARWGSTRGTLSGILLQGHLRHVTTQRVSHTQKFISNLIRKAYYEKGVNPRSLSEMKLEEVMRLVRGDVPTYIRQGTPMWLRLEADDTPEFKTSQDDLADINIHPILDRKISSIIQGLDETDAVYAGESPASSFARFSSKISINEKNVTMDDAVMPSMQLREVNETTLRRVFGGEADKIHFEKIVELLSSNVDGPEIGQPIAAGMLAKYSTMRFLLENSSEIVQTRAKRIAELHDGSGDDRKVLNTYFPEIVKFHDVLDKKPRSIYNQFNELMPSVGDIVLIPKRAEKGSITRDAALLEIKKFREKYLSELMTPAKRAELENIDRVPFLESDEYFALAFKAALKEMILGGDAYLTVNMTGDAGTNSGLRFTKAKDIYGSLIPAQWGKNAKKAGVPFKGISTPVIPVKVPGEAGAALFAKAAEANKVRLDAATKLLELTSLNLKDSNGEPMKKGPAIPIDKGWRIQAALSAVLLSEPFKPRNFQKEGEVTKPSELSKHSFNVHNSPVLTVKRSRSEKDGMSNLSKDGISESFVYHLQDALARQGAIENPPAAGAFDPESVAGSAAYAAAKSYITNGLLGFISNEFQSTKRVSTMIKAWNDFKTKLRALDYPTGPDANYPGWESTKADVEDFIYYIDTLFYEVETMRDYFEALDETKIAHQDLLTRGFLIKRSDIPQAVVDEVNKGQLMWKPRTEGPVSAADISMGSRPWRAGFIGEVSKMNPDKIRGVRIMYIEDDDSLLNGKTSRIVIRSRDGSNIADGDKDVVVEAVNSPNSGESAIRVVSSDYSGSLAAIAINEMTTRLRIEGYNDIKGDAMNIEEALDVAKNGYGEPEVAAATPAAPAVRKPREPLVNALVKGEPEGVARSEPVAQPQQAAFKPTSWVKTREGVGFSVTSIDGYVISYKDKKFRLFNPSKVMVGVYNDEEEAKKKAEALARGKKR